jgi:hypothetical protein
LCATEHINSSNTCSAFIQATAHIKSVHVKRKIGGMYGTCRPLKLAKYLNACALGYEFVYWETEQGFWLRGAQKNNHMYGTQCRTTLDRKHTTRNFWIPYILEL